MFAGYTPPTNQNCQNAKIHPDRTRQSHGLVKMERVNRDCGEPLRTMTPKLASADRPHGQIWSGQVGEPRHSSATRGAAFLATIFVALSANEMGGRTCWVGTFRLCRHTHHCTHTRAHTHTHTHAHAHGHTHTYTFTRAYTHARTHTSAHTHTRAQSHAHKRARAHVRASPHVAFSDDTSSA